MKNGISNKLERERDDIEREKRRCTFDGEREVGMCGILLRRRRNHGYVHGEIKGICRVFHLFFSHRRFCLPLLYCFLNPPLYVPRVLHYIQIDGERERESHAECNAHLNKNVVSEQPNCQRGNGQRGSSLFLVLFIPFIQY